MMGGMSVKMKVSKSQGLKAVVIETLFPMDCPGVPLRWSEENFGTSQGDFLTQGSHLDVLGLG
jgi:hypothetical protein